MRSFVDMCLLWFFVLEIEFFIVIIVGLLLDSHLGMPPASEFVPFISCLVAFLMKLKLTMWSFFGNARVLSA